MADRLWYLVLACKPCTLRDGSSSTAQRGFLYASLSLLVPINQGDNMCALLMRSHTMQTAASEGNKGSEQLVFVVPEMPSSKFPTHLLEEIKQIYSTTKTAKNTGWNLSNAIAKLIFGLESCPSTVICKILSSPTCCHVLPMFQCCQLS